MAKCPNCGANIGCVCKLRTTKSGKQCCTNCINTCENVKAASNTVVNVKLDPRGNNRVVVPKG